MTCSVSPISYRLLIQILIVCALLVGCSSGSGYRAPIADAASIPSHKIHTYTVAKGDTVYSIAWRFNIDYKDLARANGLSGHYRIYPGQVLTLAVLPAQAEPSAKPTAVVTAPQKKEQKSSKNQSSEAPKKGADSTSVGAIKWVWPAAGQVVARFSGSGGPNKGIDIRGHLGEPVVAAADGVVVYAGSGLRGYGKLLIVKHSDKVLSAYAHNQVLHVAEGERVKAAQKIAQIGYTGTQAAKLHFEIRYDGTPVDPLAYLPKR